ncbi:MAG TPA: hypothetical protein DCR93_00375 [Cytophagales bacterium]|nr:hypothetical protein [Cytophagales bacterium]
MSTTLATHKKIGPLGSALDFTRDAFQFLKTLHGYDAPVVKFRLAHLPGYYLRDPNLAQTILRKYVHEFKKGGPAFGTARKLMGDGLPVSKGDLWIRQRRTISPAFHHRCLDAYQQVMQQQIVAAFDQVEVGKSIEAFGMFSTMSFQVIRYSLFGAQLTEEEVACIAEFVNISVRQSAKRSRMGFNPPAWLPVMENARLRKVTRESRESLRQAIRAKMEQGKEPGTTLLDMLLYTPDPKTGEKMPMEQVIHEAIIFFVAGSDTTASGLSWLPYVLAENPVVHQQLTTEIEHVVGDGFPTLTDYLERMPYTQRVLKEVLRINAPVWILTRQLKETTEVDGYVFPKGANVFMSPLMMHYDERFWADPEAFDPDRFVQPEADTLQSYMPFGVGPRRCIGERFAELEIALTLIYMVQHFTWTIENTRPPEFNFDSTLTLKEGMWVKWHRRA